MNQVPNPSDTDQQNNVKNDNKFGGMKGNLKGGEGLEEVERSNEYFEMPYVA